MQEKSFILINKGMNRDLSVSKAGESAAFDNHNIRIEARDGDTTLSVTNERGNKEIVFPDDDPMIEGLVIGWNVLNEHIILFTHKEEEKLDRIYRVDYDGELFRNTLLFHGNLEFDSEYPIESIVSFETDNVQKIYWIDGKNVLRFMNFMDEERIADNWNNDATAFDSNRPAKFTAKVKVEKDNSGNTRPNGAVQYLLTYFNKHGQETNYTWMSDVVYLAPNGRGGAEDETNNNQITLTFSGLDTTYSHFRVYSVFNSSLDGERVSYLVYEGKTSDDDVVVTDDAGHLTLQDSTRLLYLGSQALIAGTISHKDETLFLGDLKSVGKGSYTELEKAIKRYMYNPETGVSSSVHFAFSSGDDGPCSDIKYVENSGTYPYSSQLQYTSSEILSFKGNEKYRFGLKFQIADGTETDAFWIGDATNPLYPIVDKDGGRIHRPVAICTIPREVVNVILKLEPKVKTIQLVMAEATYADRSVKAQGIINPTVFNTWERYQDRLYTMPSWCARPRNGSIANKHFEIIHKSTRTTGELACNYWEDESNSVPYFRYTEYDSSQPKYYGKFDGKPDVDLTMIVYGFREGVNEQSLIRPLCSHLLAYIIYAKAKDGYSADDLKRMLIPELPTEQDYHGWERYTDDNKWSMSWSSYAYFVKETTEAELTVRVVESYEEKVFWWNMETAYDEMMSNCYSCVKEHLIDTCDIDINSIVPENVVIEWGKISISPIMAYSSREFYSTVSYNKMDIANATPLEKRWITSTDITGIEKGDFTSAKYKKHLAYVDENVFTFNSPELSEEAVHVDNAKYKFRIVGVAKMTSNVSDYKIDAEQGWFSGDNIYNASFTGTIKKRGNTEGLITWPLWKDSGLKYDGTEPDVKKREMSDFSRTGQLVGYWMYTFGKSGNITGYYDRKKDTVSGEPEDKDYDEHEYSILHKKYSANLHFSYESIFAPSSEMEYEPESLREFNYLSSQTLMLKVAGETKYYDGVIDTSFGLPGTHKYPIMYSPLQSNTEAEIFGDDVIDSTIFTDMPVHIQYNAPSHAIISLPSTSAEYYEQEILPYIFTSDITGNITRTIDLTGALVPWIDYKKDTGIYHYRDYNVVQKQYKFDECKQNARAGSLSESDSYLLIGEIYDDFSENDTRYGGITESSVQSNRFIPAGPARGIENFSIGEEGLVYGNQGDTYFQRWDCVKTKPYSNDAEYAVTDIISFLVETHINLDGRTDLQRGINNLTDIDFSTYGHVNPVYSQKNNFKIVRDLDEDFNTDGFRSSLTWTLPKADLADVDEWTHITLATNLKLDGDKGICRAIRRYNNTLIAFQDKGISEILFNSRTQLTTSDGVPVEIGNSGKVDGKYYFSNKYGCTNKWSIVEGKAGLYFVDNTNKSLCAVNVDERKRMSIRDLSTRLGFSAWFRVNNKMKSWTPKNFENIVSYYDKIHSDVYLITKDAGNESCLVYNENLGTFSSFYDYNAVSMMANVRDKFVSYKRGSSTNGLWLQNEGLYCNFFGEQYSFWATYRVAPEPVMDKIWTNVEFQSDFFRVLDENGKSVIEPEFDLTSFDMKNYRDEETFDELRIWNEYQDTGKFIRRPEKKFRTWRHYIPRAAADDRNIAGLDRIRNPWINLKLKKNPYKEENRDLVQLHDIVVKYFE